jgi:uncharacterized protein (DUF58 family)
MKINIHKWRLRIYLVVLIASIVFASFYGGPVSFVWLHGVALLLPLSAVYLFASYHCLRIFQELDVIKLTKGETHTYHVVLENDGIFPIYNMTLFLYTDRCKLFDIQEGGNVSLNSFEKVELSSDIQCFYAGAYYIGIKAIRLTDPFQIFNVTLEIPWKHRAIVRPQISDLASQDLEIENIIQNLGVKSEYRFEEIPGSDNRPYVRGDSLHSINWKVSARLNELTVRLPDKMEKKRITLVLLAEKTSDDSQDIEFLKSRDYFLEFIISAAWYFSDRGIPLTVIYPSGSVVETTIRTHDDFEDFYNIVTDHIYYGTDSTLTELQDLAFAGEKSANEDETWIVIKEHPMPGERFTSICG